MPSLLSFLGLLFVALSLDLALAATAEEWRGRSIYQVITDRYALPSGADPTKCNLDARTWCGGTWKTITDNLDYIKNAGFTAVWISPVNQNYEGPPTPYGDPYHGYWMADVQQLNARFGTADDLKGLSDALHRNGMFLMVDVVVNDVMATSITPDYSKYMFKQPSQYHPFCWINWSNETSEEQCWFGDTNVPLPDINTEDPTVVSGFQTWIKNMVTEYGIDGLRIDAAKHVNREFWPQFAQAAGVFCMGEVFDADPAVVSPWQGPLDSVLQYPMYHALFEAFALPGPKNTSALANMMEMSQSLFSDTGLLGNFLENQDIPRWHNLSVDVQTLYNAMVFNFMSEGIPIVYYGQEQGFSGNADPYNREPLWPSQYAKTDKYNMITTLNTLRNHLVRTSNASSQNDWLHAKSQVMTVSSIGIAFMRGSIVTVLTNIGSPPQNGTSMAVRTPFPSSYALVDVLTCTQWVVGGNGQISVQYTKGGVPVVLAPNAALVGSSLCQAEVASARPASLPAQSDSIRPRPSLHLYLVLGLVVYTLLALIV